MNPAHNPYDDLNDTQYQAIVDGTYEKATASNGTGGCLTLTAVGGYIGLQDDKLPAPERKDRTHVYTPAELRAFIDGAKNGEFDHLI